MTEQWRWLNGYDNSYMVSDLGRIKSLTRDVEWGNGKAEWKGQMIKTTINRTGYKCFYVSENGKTNSILLHRAIAKSFIPNHNKLPVINHIDGNKLNNSISNLEWCTQAHNNKHALSTGLRVMPKGEEHCCAKLTSRSVKEIKVWISDGIKLVRIAKLYNVTPQAIGDIKMNKTWRHINGY